MTITQMPTRLRIVKDETESYGISLLCWRCGAQLCSVTSGPAKGTGEALCTQCKSSTRFSDGLWLSLTPGRVKHFSRFVRDYELIRAAEGRGSIDDCYYLGLPYNDLSKKNSDQWAIRARTFRHIERTLVRPLSALQGRPLRILDLGAGNGWMSYRLAQAGHFPVAVDLLINDRDGLGAAVHFKSHLQSLFPRVQADLEHLPFASSSFDLAIFNASFHYSESYERSFAEAFRCVVSGGAVVIADTPWYAEEESGKKMVAEKRRHFTNKYGFASDSIHSLEYLTPVRLRQLQTMFDAKWVVSKPFYGVRWLMRPMLAKLRGRRPPSKFLVYEAWVNR